MNKCKELPNYELSARSRRKLLVAKRRDDEEILETVIEEVLERECRRWARTPQGRYGLPAEGNCDEASPNLVARAWKKLRQVARTGIVDTMDAYEAQEGGPPQFDTNDEVRRSVGGKTTTTWQSFRRGFVQVGSGRILVGDKYVCRKKRPNHDCVVSGIMKTLVHELMGHWELVGQRIGVNPQLSEEDRRSVRKDRAERRADRITSREWRRIRRSDAYEACMEEWEEDFAERKEEMIPIIENAIKQFCE